MLVSDFDYKLPQKFIAQHPPKVRGQSRLLVLDRGNGEIQDKKYGDLVDYLRAGDVLVLNDTKVIKARLKLYKVSNGAEREIVVLEKHSGDDDWHRHHVMYRGRLVVGDKLTNDNAEVIAEEILGNGIAIVSSNIDLLKLSEQIGTPPLPPYMHRDATAEDVKRYQTVFAREDGSAAAPTASLNMTKELLAKLEEKGVIVKYLTLHVGLGTFLPIRSDKVEDHDIHTEYFEIPTDTALEIQKAKTENRRVIALGTTVARTLEYCASSLRGAELRGKLDDKTATGLLRYARNDITGEADIFIYPGYEFKVIDTLITNFHAPGSTVLMLAAAFAGTDNLKKAYLHAIGQKYQFLSYGDSMLITS
ncbi:S-adenosylmethionine:tRNA ribosyltransferase-isomerase [Alphaproteobacteria bacterium]|nr:S-adenosylmethionine:tRNA ribosyltransferase-isomerase [Alphaproteobacteria bacterium]